MFFFIPSLKTGNDEKSMNPWHKLIYILVLFGGVKKLIIVVAF